MNALPKLLPQWLGATQNDIPEARYGNLNWYPDYGGCGIDFSFNAEDILLEELKNPKNVLNFVATSSVLPFLPPNTFKKAHQLTQSIIKEQERNVSFYQKLAGSKSLMKKNRNFRDSVISSYSKLQTAGNNCSVDSLYLPSSVIELANYFPRNPNSWLYTGGCLSAFSDSSSSNIFLVHPTGCKLDKLTITPTKEKQNLGLYEGQVHEQTKIKLNGGKIFQIEIESSNSNICCVRQRDKVHFINLNSSDVLLHTSEKFQVQSFEKKGVTCIGLSDSIPGEFALTTKEDLLICNAGLKKEICNLKNSVLSKSVEMDTWHSCHFGLRPQSLIYSNKFHCILVDLLCKKPSVCELLTSANSCFFKNEHLTAAKRLQRGSFQHLISTNVRLFLCDERYPQQPVMSWNHMLDTFPSFCETAIFGNDSADLITLLSSYDNQNTSLFHCNFSASSVQPVCHSLPMHLSPPKDCLRVFHFQGVCVKDYTEALFTSPLIGNSVVSSCDNCSFVVFYVTACGDIFYQDFTLNVDSEEKTYKLGPGCTLTTSDKEFHYLNQWVNSATKSESKCLQKLSKKIAFTNLEDIQFKNDCWKEKSSSLHCDFCNQQTLFPNEEFLESDQCLRCGLNTKYTKNLLEIAKNGGVLTGHVSGHEECNPYDQVADMDFVDFRKVNDSLSEKILQIWTDNNEEVSQHGRPAEKCPPFSPTKKIPDILSSQELSSNIFHSTGKSNETEVPWLQSASICDIVEEHSRQNASQVQQSSSFRPTSKLKKRKKLIVSSAGF